MRRINNKSLIIILISSLVVLILLFTVWLLGTEDGRQVIYRKASLSIYNNLNKENNNNDVDQREYQSSSAVNEYRENKEEVDKESTEQHTEKDMIEKDIIKKEPRHEEYVNNFLIFGIEEFDGAKNTDTIMIVSVNKKDNKIKLTSLLRDTLIEKPGEKPIKLNSIYGNSGAEGFVQTIEDNYLIEIDGYAYINFKSFEKIIDYLGGITIEISEEEVDYLNTTNYISNPVNRNVKPGMFVLNGNQTLGYCRIRKCPTIGGANDDYGRSIRHRRVLREIFNRYVNKNLFELISITGKCLNNINTNVSSEQIESVLTNVVENKITTIASYRIPADGIFEAPKDYRGVRDPLVLDWDSNVEKLYSYIY